MKALQILILEDSIDDAQNIINILFKDHSVTLVNTLQKAKDILISSQFDLAIIDISIDGKLDGIEFAKHIQNTSTPILFLFLISTQNKPVFDKAKLTLPFTYILKPFNVLELQYSIELAIEKRLQQKNTLRVNKALVSDNYLLVKQQQAICKVDFNKIEYVEVEENYSTLYTLTQKYVVRKSLSKIKKILTDKNFKQIHRKFLINFDWLNIDIVGLLYTTLLTLSSLLINNCSLIFFSLLFILL